MGIVAVRCAGITRLVYARLVPARLVAVRLAMPTMTMAMLFIGGVQLVSIGIIGEYIGRIYDEVRSRPHYIVDKKINVRQRDA